MIPLLPFLLLFSISGYVSSPLLLLLFIPPSSSPLPINFTLTSSGHLQAHLSLDLVRYLLPTLVQFVALVGLAILSLHLANELLNSRVASGRWITRGWLNMGRMTKAEWERQVILITGGAGGLGREIGRRALQKGACVVTLDVANLPEEPGQKHMWFHYRCDVTQIDRVEETAKLIKFDLELRQKAAGERGISLPKSPTVLINNAAIHSLTSPSSQIVTLTSEKVSRVLEVNVLSQFHILRTFLPSILCRGKGGHVVNVSSSMGHVPASGMADYVSSKFAVIGLHEVLCRELRAWRRGECDEAMVGMVNTTARIDDAKQRQMEQRVDGLFSSLSAAASQRVQTTLLLPSHISTPLFPYWVYPWPFNLLTPTLTPTQVADRVIEEIGERRSRWVYLPSLTWPAGWMGVLSDWMREVMFYVSGSDSAVVNMRASAQKATTEGSGHVDASAVQRSSIKTRAQKAANGA